jgi:hypothetical protein
MNIVVILVLKVSINIVEHVNHVKVNVRPVMGNQLVSLVKLVNILKTAIVMIVYLNVKNVLILLNVLSVQLYNI